MFALTIVLNMLAVTSYRAFGSKDLTMMLLVAGEIGIRLTMFCLAPVLLPQFKPLCLRVYRTIFFVRRLR